MNYKNLKYPINGKKNILRVVEKIVENFEGTVKNQSKVTDLIIDLIDKITNLMIILKKIIDIIFIILGISKKINFKIIIMTKMFFDIETLPAGEEKNKRGLPPCGEAGKPAKTKMDKGQIKRILRGL